MPEQATTSHSMGAPQTTSDNAETADAARTSERIERLLTEVRATVSPEHANWFKSMVVGFEGSMVNDRNVVGTGDQTLLSASGFLDGRSTVHLRAGSTLLITGDRLQCAACRSGTSRDSTAGRRVARPASHSRSPTSGYATQETESAGRNLH